MTSVDGSDDWMELVRVERDGLDAAESHYRDRFQELDRTENDKLNRELAKLSGVRQLRALGDRDE
ncbi:hypothetical protein DJ69_12785 [Halorubrum persicum]|uniref:Uncharacterized protein n=1 Tax=Halorubrum persicum TaxID=1383844 RepID=A0A2G1WGW3_9EURY|nr:hypothetical protein [Halorubrum persicum]PHQ38224.1 hypothetical protein DJ69_12785 [Halorubrum persicum]